jgi:hypothetical protein
VVISCEMATCAGWCKYTSTALSSQQGRVLLQQLSSAELLHFASGPCSLSLRC